MIFQRITFQGLITLSQLMLCSDFVRADTGELAIGAVDLCSLSHVSLGFNFLPLFTNLNVQSSQGLR